MQSKTIVVTGAAGFIGSHVCDRLIQEGRQVVGIDNFNDFYDPQIKKSNIQHLKKKPRFKIIKSDIRKLGVFDQIFEESKVDGVIHLAARAGVRPSLEDPKLYWDVNVMGSLNLLESMKQHQVKQLVFASSSSVYGDRQNGPFKENDNTDYQISPYGASKKALEVLTATYSSLYGIQTTGLRFFTVYGPRNRPQMACSNFMQAIHANKPITKYGDGTTGRDYTFIDDIVDGIILALNNPFDYEIINLGNSSPILLNQLIETVEQVTNKKAEIISKPIQAGDVTYTYADISKAKKLLNWHPATSFKEGIELLYDWYKSSLSN